MEQNNDRNVNDRQPRNPFEGSLSDYMDIILKHRRFISYLVGAAFLVSIIVSLLLPKMYKATARILPPQENSTELSSLLTGIDNSLSRLAGNLIGNNNSSAALYVGIIKSRSVAEELNKKFNLKKRYGLKYIEDVYQKLAGRSIIGISKKDQIINVSVIDRDPQHAADMANAYVRALDQINRKLNITRGKRKRLFLESRLKEVRADLVRAEVNLKEFQEKHNLVSIEEQAKVAIEGAAHIKGEIIAAETELEVFKQFGTERQVEAVMLNAKIEELQKQLDTIEKGDKYWAAAADQPKSDRGSNFFIPFDKLPHLGLQLMRLTRDAKIQGKLFELLISQYEMAKIEESKDVNTVQVLDHAVKPEKKISPRRSRIVLSATIVMFFIAAIFVISREYR